MLKSSKLGLLTILMLWTGFVFAQNDPKMYTEVGYTSVTYKEAGYTLKPSALRGIIGYEINPNFAAEAMLGFGVADSSVVIRGVNVNFSIGTMAGVYVKPKVSISDGVELFGRFGYAKSGGKASVSGYSLTTSGTDTSYGGGMKIKMSNNTDAVIDYMSYYDKNGATATGITFGLGFKF